MHTYTSRRATYATRKIPARLCKSTRIPLATVSIFRCKNKLLDASCRSGCRSTTRRIGQKGNGKKKKRRKFKRAPSYRTQWHGYRHLVVAPIRHLPADSYAISSTEIRDIWISRGISPSLRKTRADLRQPCIINVLSYIAKGVFSCRRSSGFSGRSRSSRMRPCGYKEPT